MKSDKLKPCPFCGGKATLMTKVGPAGNYRPFYQVCCVNLCCEVLPETVMSQSEERVRMAWNRRGKR